ncbi:Protein of unknown function [Gryllus bimaculatus]|nr:Protein of unknown function [Gryllus bimaculatus]
MALFLAAASEAAQMTTRAYSEHIFQPRGARLREAGRWSRLGNVNGAITGKVIVKRVLERVFLSASEETKVQAGMR